jgi:4-hydroxybenzoyl-CoA thioesterase
VRKDLPDDLIHPPNEGAMYRHRYPVRFADFDPAGIVFFPHYLEMLNGLVEDWFNEALGIGYATLLIDRRIGLPTVSLECQFQAPSRLGEILEFRLQVGRLGRRSFTLDVECVGAGQTRVRLRQVLVTMAVDVARSVDIPDDLRAAIERWQHAPAPTPGAPVTPAARRPGARPDAAPAGTSKDNPG